MQELVVELEDLELISKSIELCRSFPVSVQAYPITVGVVEQEYQIPLLFLIQME
jgi:hypothetical protein